VAGSSSEPTCFVAIWVPCYNRRIMAELTSEAQGRVSRLAVKTWSWSKVVLSLLSVLVVSGAFYSVYLFFDTVRASVARTTLPIMPNTAPIGDDVTSSAGASGQDLPDIVARSETFNILVLGIDQREGETGPSRTDTIILVSVDLVEKSAAMLSIPRDLWVTIPGFGEDRINTAHYYGDLYDYPGGGTALVKKTIQHNFGVTVHRVVRVNFVCFESLIDAIDGITLDVPYALHDEEFPDGNSGTMVLDIPAGVQHMDGARALQYARSRHSTSDYDRMSRQQAVVLAAIDKVRALDFPLSRLPNMLEVLGDSLYTDLSLYEIRTLAQLAMDISTKDIRHAVINETMTVTAIRTTGAMVEVPDWNLIRGLVNDMFPPNGLDDDLPDLVRAQLADEAARIELQNGSLDTNLAADAADHLRVMGFNVIRYDNADRFDHAATIIHDRTGNEYTARALAEQLGVDPDAIQRTDSIASEADIVVILGRDCISSIER